MHTDNAYLEAPYSSNNLMFSTKSKSNMHIYNAYLEVPPHGHQSVLLMI